MKVKKLLGVCALIIFLVTGVVACGNSTADSANESTPLPAADLKANVDSVLGAWVDISAADRFVNITKIDTEYQYEDNEGKYPATFQDGILKVKVSESDLAEAYLDPKSGHLISVYQGDVAEFSKK